MADNPAKVPEKIEKTSPSTLQPFRPFESLRREVDRLFDDFSGGFWRSPFGRSFFDIEPFRRAEAGFGVAVPAVDVTQTDKGYEITAELPGMEEKDVEVKLSNGILTIKGEKRVVRHDPDRAKMRFSSHVAHEQLDLQRNSRSGPLRLLRALISGPRRR